MALFNKPFPRLCTLLLCSSLAPLSLACGNEDDDDTNKGPPSGADSGGSSDKEDTDTATGGADSVGEGSGGMSGSEKDDASGGAPADDKNTGGDEGDDTSTGGDEGMGGDTQVEERTLPNFGDGEFGRPVVFSDDGQLDLLFVLDNSLSMADKQELLAKAVPQMLQRLIDPDCVDDSTGENIPNPGTCPSGYTQKSRAFKDIHIGLISSSLGGHGSEFCPRDGSRDGVTLYNDDRGRLISTMRPDLPAGDGVGFLAWTGEGGGEARDQLVSDFKEQVAGTGEYGCGFEAPLEAWYRFLVDPRPPGEIVLNDDGQAVVKDDEIDSVVLAQREEFLRPESWVAIVVLTDENDCSAMDGGSYYDLAAYGHLVTDPLRPMTIASPVCNANPNDKCCFSCQQTPPEGCEQYLEACEGKPALPPENDRGNTRCFDGKRRFGVDLLYPTDRYVEALTQTTIIDARTGEEAPNALLSGAGSSQGIYRNPRRVFFAGIVGVPWQDLATPESLEEDSPRLKYLNASELAEKNVDIDGALVSRWQIILGEPGRAASSKFCELSPDNAACGRASVPPLDPFMIESISERTAGLTNPITGDAIVASSSLDPHANAINGHEANHDVTGIAADGGPARDDLQNVCTFELEEPMVDCAPDDYTCDCADEPTRNRSLCQPPEGGEAATTQYLGKAYPGTRILRVLRDFGANSIVGSICPKFSTGDSEDLNFGYNPVLKQLVNKVHVFQAGSCFPRELDLDEDGNLACAVLELRSKDEGDLNCSRPGRLPLSKNLRAAAATRLEAEGECAGDTGVSCDAFSICAILELEGADRDECLYEEVDTTDEAGFCYIDPKKSELTEAGLTEYVAGGGEDGTNPIVANCALGQKRMLRFTGANTPSAGAQTFVLCDSSTGQN